MIRFRNRKPDSGWTIARRYRSSVRPSGMQTSLPTDRCQGRGTRRKARGARSCRSVANPHFGLPRAAPLSHARSFSTTPCTLTRRRARSTVCAKMRFKLIPMLAPRTSTPNAATDQAGSAAMRRKARLRRHLAFDTDVTCLPFHIVRGIAAHIDGQAEGCVHASFLDAGQGRRLRLTRARAVDESRQAARLGHVGTGTSASRDQA